MNRVAVTGLGIVAPGGNDPDEFFANLLEGRSAIGLLPEARCTRLETRVAAQAELDAAKHFPAPRLRMLDRVSHTSRRRDCECSIA
jgi:3-oxoacyl-(acyl-carrier-protein) synthase